MSEFDDRLNSILSNPAMMQQIMTLAQSLNQSNQSNPAGPSEPRQAPPPPPAQQSAPMPSPEQVINPNLLNQIAGLMQRGSIDKNQESLLKALRPYLSGQKLEKLERAMHAAKIAGIASDLMNSRGLNPFSGR